MSYGRKTFKERAQSALKKLTLVAAFGAAAGVPAYYHYGTVQEQEVTVRDVKEQRVWNAKTSEEDFADKRIVTDKGAFRNENSWLWFKGDADALQEQFQKGKTYLVRSYGHLPMGIGTPNIISAREITQEEQSFRDREKARQAQDGARTSDTIGPPAPQQDAPVSTTRVVITAHGYDVEMIVPAAAVPHIRIEGIAPSKPVHIVQPPNP